MTHEEAQEVDLRLTQFLKLLVDCFNEPAAIKALEHLVRNFRVHVYHVDDCVACGMVYHSTVEFQKLLSLLDLNESRWHWMSDLQKSHLPFQREILVNRCLTDHSVLEFVCGMAKWSSEEAFRNTRVYPFFAILVCEVLEKVEEVSEAMVRCLMSTIAAGLKEEVPNDFRQAVYMVIVQLCTKAALSEKAISALLQSLLERRTEKDTSQVIIIMSHIYNTQSHYAHAPQKILKLLFGIEQFSALLAGLMHKGLNAKQMLSVLLTRLVNKAKSGREAWSLLESLIMEAQIEAHVSEMTSVVFGQANEETVESMRCIIHALDIRFPLLLDQCVNAFLKHETDANKKQAVLSLLHGSRNALLHWQAMNTDLTLLAAADAPDDETRKAALEQFKCLDQSEQSPEVIFLLGEVLLRRLVDDSFPVAAAAVQCDLDTISNSEALLSALMHLLGTAMERLLHGCDAIARDAAIKVVTYLADNAADRFPDSSEEICLLVLEHIFPHCQEQIIVSVAMGQLLRTLDHPIAQRLAQELDFLSECNEDISLEAFIEELVNSLGSVDPGCMVQMFARCPLRVRCYLCAAIPPKIQEISTASDSDCLIQCIIDQLDQICREGNLHQRPHRVQWTKETTVTYESLLLRALRDLAESDGNSEMMASFDKHTSHKVLHLVLGQSGCHSDVMECARQVANVFWRNAALPNLMHFLTLPMHDEKPAAVVRGLSVARLYLTQEVSEEVLGLCVLSLCTLLGRSEDSIRKATLKLVKKVKVAVPSDGEGDSVFSVVLQYLKEYHLRIKSDPSGATALLSAFLAPDDAVSHKAKKRKTMKEAATQSGAVSTLLTYFLSQFRELSLSAHTRKLQTLFNILKGTVPDSTLLFEALPLLEAPAGSNLTGEEEQLLVKVVDLFHVGVIPALPGNDHIAQALHVFSRCLLPFSATAVKKAALALMSPKWMKEIEAHGGQKILLALLQCANKDRHPEVTQKAAQVAAKWPLRRHHLEKCLNLVTDEDEMEELDSIDQRQFCMWTLDLLYEKEKLSEHLGIVELLQKLLTEIDSSALGRQLDDDDMLLSICRSAFALLTKVCSSKEFSASEELNVDLMIKYLGWTTDAVLRESVHSLLRCVADSNPTLAINHVVQVLTEIVSGVSDDDQYQAHFQKATQSITAFVRIVVGNRDMTVEIWKAIVPTLITLSEKLRLTVLNAVLDGLGQNKFEGIGMGLVVLMPSDTEDRGDAAEEDRKTVALSLCELADLSDRNRALATAMKAIRACFQNESDALFPQNLLGLIISVLKNRLINDRTLLASSMDVSESNNSGTGFEEILMQTILELSHVESLKPDSAAASLEQIGMIQRKLRQLLHILSDCMDPNYFLRTLGQIVKDLDAATWPTALDAFRRKLSEITQDDGRALLGLSPEICEVCPCLLTALQSGSLIDEDSLQMVLATIQQLTHTFASNQPEIFMDCVLTVAEYTKHESSEIRGSALACLASFVREIGEDTVRHLPQLMPIVLDSLTICIEGHDGDMSEEDPDILDLVSGLALIEALLDVLGTYLSPYLKQLLKIIFHPMLPSSETVATAHGPIPALLAESVPLRLLLPELLACYDWIVTESRRFLNAYFTLLDQMISGMNHSTAEQFLDTMTTFFLKVFGLRHHGSVSEVSLAESSAIAAFVTLVMKLNEKQFKPLLDALLDWMFEDTATTAHHITGFHILSELMQKLKTLFVGYLPAFLNSALELGSVDVGKKPWTDQHADLSHRNMYVLKFYIIQCLCRSLVYDDDGDVVHQQIAEKIVSLAMKHLRKCRSPSEDFMHGIEDLQITEISFTGIQQFHRDPLTTATAQLLIELGKRSELQKTVNHKVLRCCSKGGSYCSALSLCIVREIVSHARDEFTPLVPETLPRVAEMLEVPSIGISSIAREIIALLKEITGEDFEQRIQHN